MKQQISYSLKGLEGYFLFNQDCLRFSQRLPDNSIDLIYVDPPFFSDRVYEYNGHFYEDIWVNIHEYLDWLKPRFTEFHRILKDTGTIFIHCDWHAAHNLKVQADEVFGRKNFLNEIVWKRQSCHNNAGQGSRHFGRIHDTILVYTKSSSYTWNQQYTNYDDSYVKKAYRFVEAETKRKYALGDLTAPGGAAKGNARYEFLGVERYWRYSQANMLQLFINGKIHYKKGRVPLLKRYLDEMKGRPVQDLWIDIKPVSSRKMQYPTQKPIALLERIINTSSNPNQVVYDPFSGSGTCGIVSYKLSRNWIGSEISSDACEIIRSRFEDFGCSVKYFSESSRFTNES